MADISSPVDSLFSASIAPPSPLIHKEKPTRRVAFRDSVVVVAPIVYEEEETEPVQILDDSLTSNNESFLQLSPPPPAILSPQPVSVPFATSMVMPRPPPSCALAPIVFLQSRDKLRNNNRRRASSLGAVQNLRAIPSMSSAADMIVHQYKRGGRRRSSLFKDGSGIPIRLDDLLHYLVHESYYAQYGRKVEITNSMIATLNVIPKAMTTLTDFIPRLPVMRQPWLKFKRSVTFLVKRAWRRGDEEAQEEDALELQALEEERILARHARIMTCAVGFRDYLIQVEHSEENLFFWLAYKRYERLWAVSVHREMVSNEEYIALLAAESHNSGCQMIVCVEDALKAEHKMITFAKPDAVSHLKRQVEMLRRNFFEVGARYEIALPQIVRDKITAEMSGTCPMHPKSLRDPAQFVFADLAMNSCPRYAAYARTKREAEWTALPSQNYSWPALFLGTTFLALALGSSILLTWQSSSTFVTGQVPLSIWYRLIPLLPYYLSFIHLTLYMLRVRLRFFYFGLLEWRWIPGKLAAKQGGSQSDVLTLSNVKENIFPKVEYQFVQNAERWRYYRSVVMAIVTPLALIMALISTALNFIAPL